jgi:CMP-N-acetylneuraminic acid synthetase
MKSELACVLYARQGSKGIPRKNHLPLPPGRVPSYQLVLRAAAESGGAVFTCTDDAEIALFAQENGIGVIPRPAALAGDEALLEDVIAYTYREVLHDFEYSAILLANAPFVTGGLIREAHARLGRELHLDSVITVGKFPMFAPERARKAEGDRLVPYAGELTESASCDRSTHQNCYFANGALTLVRSRSLVSMAENMPPFRWMGRNIGYIEQPPGIQDIDNEWQIAVSEWWLRKNLY